MSYIIAKALLTTRYIKFIDQQEFTIAVFDKNNKAFVIYIAFIAINTKIFIHPFWTAQIALLSTDEAFIIVSKKYSNFADIFLLKSVLEL